MGRRKRERKGRGTEGENIEIKKREKDERT